MKKILIVLIAAANVGSCLLSELHAKNTEAFTTQYIQPDLENVPIETLIENLKKQVELDSKNAGLYLNLARVYGMAYAKKTNELSVNKRHPNAAWFGYDASHVPYGEIVKSDDSKTNEVAKENLKLSIENFEKAIELDDENLTAQLGLAWSLDQLGKEEQCIELYRDIIEESWKQEKDKRAAGPGWHSIVVEAARYLKPKLDKDADAAEIAEIDKRIAEISRIPRAITPIAVPLGKDHSLEAVIDREVAVKFDLDGTGIKKRWQWIKPTAGWLVYDKTGNKEIGSALQLFGNVTFWCFWDDGYAALSSLDADQNGMLEGAELENICVWQDLNSNGISESNEVNSLAHHRIVRINCQSEKHKTQIKWSENGVHFDDGTTAPTYDIVLANK